MFICAVLISENIHVTESDDISSVKDRNSSVTMDLSDVSPLFGLFIEKKRSLHLQMSKQKL